MKNANLYRAWIALFILCGVLGFIPEVDGMVKAICVLAAIGFFVMPVWLLLRFVKSGDRKGIQLVRNLSLISLGGTLLLLIGNFLAVGAPQWLGDVLYALLTVVSVPMVCSRYWAVSLFAWACLLMASLSALGRKKH